MTCEELRDDYEAYAVGSATDPERSEISAHLGRSCPLCTSGVRTAMTTTAAIAGAVKVVDPPRSLRRRIIALVKPGQQWSWAVLAPWAVAAALALVFLLKFPGAQPASDARLSQAISILEDPATRDVSFGEPAARGRVFVHSGKGVVFIAAHLPALEAGRTFELWVIPNSGNPIPAGTFASEKDATAMYVRPGPVVDAAALAVTVEPAGGSAQPTTKPFIVTKL
ncbi:MAG: anti-sigma factor [Terriglobia bacterium]